MNLKALAVICLAVSVFSAVACADAGEDVEGPQELIRPVPTWTNTPRVLFSIGTVVVPAPTRASPTATPQPPTPTPDLLEGIVDRAGQALPPIRPTRLYLHVKSEKENHRWDGRQKV